MAASPSVAPLFLRLALAVIFVWAGLGKIVETMPVQGQRAALLANMGVIKPGSVDVKPTGSTPSPSQNGTSSTTPGKSRPAPSEPLPAGDKGPAPLMRLEQTGTRPVYGASDFPDEIQVRRLYDIALLVQSAANPPPDVTGKRTMALFPAAAASDHWPVYIAWAVTIIEVAAGVLVFVGLFTRFSALLLLGVMGGAIWLTEVGPALQAGTTMLGFLPKREAFDGAWQPLLLQFTLLMAAAALLCLGGGGMSLDRGIFAKAPPKNKPKPDA